MNSAEIIKKAQKKAAKLQKLRKDLRYQQTIGKLKREGLLDIRDIKEYRGQVFLDDALWAAELEPRIYELLPALVARRPKVFTFLELPEDLKQIVRDLKLGHPIAHYHGVAPEKYARWFSFVGYKKTTPRLMRSFRLGVEDLEILETLAERTQTSHTEVIVRALQIYMKKFAPTLSSELRQKKIAERA